MKYIARKEFTNTKPWSTQLERNEVTIPKLLNSIMDRPSNLRSFSDGMDAALIAEGLGLGPDVVWPFLNVGVDFGAAHFVSCYELDGVQQTICYQGVDYPYAVRKAEAWSSDFFSILSAAVVARNDTAAKVLCRVPVDRFPIKGSRKFNAQLVAILSSQEPSIEELDITIEYAIDPDTSDKDVRRYDQLILAPLFKTYRAVLQETMKEYEELFAAALRSHIEFYEPEGPNHLQGLMSFKLMAVAVLAFDRFGWKVPVESRIVSRWMVEGAGLDR